LKIIYYLYVANLNQIEPVVSNIERPLPGIWANLLVPVEENTYKNYLEKVCLNRLTSAEIAPFSSVINENFSKENVSQALASNGKKLVVGPTTSKELLAAVASEIEQTKGGFVYACNTTPENVSDLLEEILAREGLFINKPEIKEQFIADVRRDLINFSKVIDSKTVSLRIVLEDGSNLRELIFNHSADRAALKDQVFTKMIKEIGYNYSFIYHADEHTINQSKIYYGIPTLCFDHQQIANDNSISEEGWNLPLLSAWTTLVDKNFDVVEAITEALTADELDSAYAFLKVYLKEIWEHQLNAADLLNEGSKVFYFTPGAPNIYLGVPEKMGKERVLLHARPMVWAVNPYAKRFLVLMEPPN
jgi:hypothetical protein